MTQLLGQIKMKITENYFIHILDLTLWTHSYSPNLESKVPFCRERSLRVNLGPSSWMPTFFSFLKMYLFLITIINITITTTTNNCVVKLLLDCWKQNRKWGFVSLRIITLFKLDWLTTWTTDGLFWEIKYFRSDLMTHADTKTGTQSTHGSSDFLC